MVHDSSCCWNVDILFLLVARQAPIQRAGKLSCLVVHRLSMQTFRLLFEGYRGNEGVEQDGETVVKM